MRSFLSALFIILGILGALYTSIWWGIVEPVTNVANMIDTNTVTTSAVVKEIFKFFFRELVAVVVFLIGAAIAFFIDTYNEN